MEIEDRGRGRRGCLVGVIVVAGVVLASAVAVGVWLYLAANDPTSTGYELLRVARGEMPAEQLLTEIVVGRMARRAGVPADEAAALEREVGPISRDLPNLSEGEKEKLANLIRGAIEDGRVTDDELAAIREYSYRSARDGNVKP
jgi:hypothetical protein